MSAATATFRSLTAAAKMALFFDWIKLNDADFLETWMAEHIVAGPAKVEGAKKTSGEKKSGGRKPDPLPLSDEQLEIIRDDGVFANVKVDALQPYFNDWGLEDSIEVEGANNKTRVIKNRHAKALAQWKKFAKENGVEKSKPVRKPRAPKAAKPAAEKKVEAEAADEEKDMVEVVVASAAAAGGAADLLSEDEIQTILGSTESRAVKGRMPAELRKAFEEIGLVSENDQKRALKQFRDYLKANNLVKTGASAWPNK